MRCGPSAYTKERRLSPESPAGSGDVWTWIGMDTASRLIVAWAVGDRGPRTGRAFFENLSERIAVPVPITTDQYRTYPEVIDRVFGPDAYHRVMVRPRDRERGEGEEWPTTARVERHNLTLRMGNRRFTRKTNAFSKKLHRHAMALSVFFTHYNSVRLHASLGTTPAVAAGLCKEAYTMEWFAKMVEAAQPKLNRPKRYKIYPDRPLGKMLGS